MDIFFKISFYLLFLITNVAIGQNQQKLDSLKNQLTDCTSDDSILFLVLVGEEYFQSDDFSTALECFFLSLKLAESQGNIEGIADAANSIGRVYYDMESYKDALEYFNRAYVDYQEIGSEQDQGGALNNMALIYYELDSTDLAVKYYEEALAIKEKFNNKLDLAAIKHNLGLVYLNQKNYNSAIKNLTFSRAVFDDLGYKRHAANATNNIGRAYFRNGNYQVAARFFEEGLQEAKAINSSFLIMDNYKYQSDCYARMSNYKEAYRLSNEYYVIKDSLLNIEKNKELAEIEAKYENEIKEHENILLKKENETKEATIKAQYIFGVGIFTFLIMAIILVVIYFKANQSKKKANEILHVQKLEIADKNQTLVKLNNDIKSQNEEINQQKHELEELNSIKDKLFSIISHEFRSPLNSLKGTLTLLEDGVLSKDELGTISRELTDKINSTSIFLDNLLNWAKSQMQGINPKPVEVDLKEHVDNNIVLLRSMAEKKKVAIENKIINRCQVFIDPNMLDLILRNLISNAIKFSLRGGKIVVTMENNGKKCTISVTDSGIGMTEENLKMLFQVQSFTTRGTANERGTGIGLYISKNFIESNGGKIWVESKKGQGSTFNISMPSVMKETTVS